jgi:ornithine cyclodeaminase
MKVISKAQLEAMLDPQEVIAEVIGLMREALIAHARGECDMPMPMHLTFRDSNGTEGDAEVHVKSSYRRGGKYFVLKMAGTFPANRAKGLSTGCGMMVLCSAETGEPLALFDDQGYLTDYRTAAVAAAVARALGREDQALGILGTGIQARLQARLHAAVLDLKKIVIWGRTSTHVAECAFDLGDTLPGVEIGTVAQTGDIGKDCKLIVTCTGSRSPLLMAGGLQPGTHISAVGSDSTGKQELYPGLVRRAALLLADSRAQCEKLGELQHSPTEHDRAIEAGDFMLAPPDWERTGITVCDFTGLGVEDLFIAEYCYQKSQ